MALTNRNDDYKNSNYCHYTKSKNIATVDDYLMAIREIESTKKSFQIRWNSFKYTASSICKLCSKKLACLIITGKLYFENGTFRTTKINEVIDAKLSIGNGFKQKCLLKMSCSFVRHPFSWKMQL